MSSTASPDTKAAGDAAAPARAPRRLRFNPRQSGIYVAFALIIVLFSVLTGVIFAGRLTRPARPPAPRSNWTPSPPRSSAARPCRAAWARWSARSPAA